MPYGHVPVMLNEAVALLNCQPGKVYVDGTLGGSGHALKIMESIAPDGLLIGVDQDMDAIRNARAVFEAYGSAFRSFHGNFAQIGEFLAHLKVTAVDGILLDLGLSLHQLTSSGRGFSFKRDEPLDMRMDTRSEVTAEDLVNTLGEDQLSGIFKAYGEERWARSIARRIVVHRQRQPLQTSLQLAQVVSAAIPKRVAAKYKIHPATRVFMALRIAVNKELDRLEEFMLQVADWLQPKGRLCILSFHSLEDRLVKRQLQRMARTCVCPPDFPQCICDQVPLFRILTRKALRPQKEEIAANPMARSTRLRAAERC
jgi:16S rRNA (cytosine1402-N4)-methyltransferase